MRCWALRTKYPQFKVRVLATLRVINRGLETNPMTSNISLKLLVAYGQWRWEAQGCCFEGSLRRKLGCC